MNVEIGKKYYRRTDYADGITPSSTVVEPVLYWVGGCVYLCRYGQYFLAYSPSGECLSARLNSHWNIDWEPPSPTAGFVPWTRTEVPYWALFQKRGYDAWWGVSGITRSMGGGDLVKLTDGNTVEMSHLLRDYEHSVDNGVTWRPCGKKEGP